MAWIRVRPDWRERLTLWKLGELAVLGALAVWVGHGDPHPWRHVGLTFVVVLVVMYSVGYLLMRYSRARHAAHGQFPNGQ